MRVVALLTVRNEELYLPRCLEHLCSQGIETCLIDNGSTDRSLEIAQRFRGRGVFRIERLPFAGHFEWRTILRNEERLSVEIDADWFLHYDADEIREAPVPFRTLREGIEYADRAGYNAVNFDEFVFLPTSNNEAYENTDYVERMRYYYFFEPSPLRQVKAWRKTGVPVNLSRSAGHRVEFDGRRIFPVNFILRHYIVLSRRHAEAKYSGRVYDPEEVAMGWHGWRARFTRGMLHFPARGRLKNVSHDGVWDKSDPRKRHEFLMDGAGTTP